MTPVPAGTTRHGTGPMKIAREITFILIPIALLITGCATPDFGKYYGYSRAEWEQLSAEEQQSAQAVYQDIIDYKHRRGHEDQFDTRKQQIIQRGAGF